MQDAQLRALIVEPDMRRATRFRSGLQAKWSLTFAAGAEQAVEQAKAGRFEAILIRVQQTSGHGLQICEALRALPDGDRAAIIIYGRMPADQRAALFGDDEVAAKARWGFDEVVRRTPPSQDLELLLQTTMRMREARLRRERAPRKLRVARPAAAKVRSARRTDVDLAQELSWGELLQSEVTAESVQMLLRKKIRTSWGAARSEDG